MERTEKITAIVKTVSKKTAVPEADESLFDAGYLDINFEKVFIYFNCA